MRLPLRALLGSIACVCPALAQIPLNGPLSDSTTGPLTSGNVYHAVGNIRIDPGQTLTIEPNVVVKFSANRSFIVGGTLLANGTGPDSIVFTDLRDDTFGGDSNADGSATSPAPGWWRVIQMLDGSDASQLDGVTVRYGGGLGVAIQMLSCDASLVDVRSELHAGDAFELDPNSRPSLVDCIADSNAGHAFDNVSIQAIPGFSNPVATNNLTNWLQANTNTIPAGVSVTIGPDNLPGGVLHPVNAVGVTAGAELVLEAGTIVKMNQASFVLANGTLRCEGTAASPVVFTDKRDDSIGGDSNGDGGATVPLPGYWRGLSIFNPTSDASVIEHATVAYAGGSSFGINFAGSSATLRDSLVRDCDTTGVTLSTTATPTIDGLTVNDCRGEALGGVPIHAIPNFSGLSFSGNDFDRVEVAEGSIPAGVSVTLDRSQTFGDVLYFRDTIFVPGNSSLTIEDGMILKFAPGRLFTVQGILTSNGTPNRRVVFTSINDDSVGGDTNADGGATSPMPGDWRELVFGATADGSSMAFTNVHYAGSVGGALVVAGASVTLNRCAVRHSATAGVSMGQTSKVGHFERLRIEDCALEAIRGILFERIQDVEFATGGGNGTNAIVVENGTLVASTSIERKNQFNDAILMRSSISVPTGIALTLEPGVNIKFSTGNTFFVAGSLFTRGTFENPVTFTSAADDTVAGDTNGDGAATSPSPGDWGALILSTQATTSIVNGLRLRYGGRNNGPTVFCASSAVRLREISASQGQGIGIQVTAHSGPLERCVSFDNGGNGVELSATGFPARQLTAVGNAGTGIFALGTYAGSVSDSIAWSNTTANFGGFSAGALRFSNGDPAVAGSDGNIDTDPLFVDEVARDLRLSELSPCIDTGDPMSPLDPDTTRADMGAFYFNACQPEVFCAQTTFPPCAPVMAYEGFASLSSPQPFTLTLNDAPTLSFAIFFYGIGGRTQINGLFGDVCVGGPYQRTPPVPSGGNPADGPCVGTFELDFNAYIQSGADPAILAGSNVIGHFWYRYTAAPGGARFSDAIEMPVCP